jgi:hypothetical protein
VKLRRLHLLHAVEDQIYTNVMSSIRNLYDLPRPHDPIHLVGFEVKERTQDLVETIKEQLKT